MKVTSNSRYFDRELSWLFFNSRVLEEASNKSVPLLERLRFLSISASNLDEFYMVRVAGLRTQVLAGIDTPGVSGYRPEKQLTKIAKLSKKIIKTQDDVWQGLHKSLEKKGLRVRKTDSLSDTELASLDSVYQQTVLPLLSPMAIDPAHPFPFIHNLGFGIALLLQKKSSNSKMNALLPIPHHVPRFVEIEGDKKGKDVVFIEDVLSHYAKDLFPDFDILECGEFRITRDSDIAVDEEAEDLVEHFEFLLKKRRRGRVIRLEIMDVLSPDLKEFLIESFECWHESIISVSTMVGMKDLSQLISSKYPDLLFPPLTARFPERIRDYDGNCFAAIAAKDILVHHPYEEFDVVIQFLEQAAFDPDVVAIKQTLYRTSDDSPIVKALIAAAERGKWHCLLLTLIWVKMSASSSIM